MRVESSDLHRRLVRAPEIIRIEKGNELTGRASDLGYAIETLPDVLVKRRIHDANMSRRRSDPGELELITIARARIARRRKPPA